MDGHWGTVCSNSWTEEDAYVVCKQTGTNAKSKKKLSEMTSDISKTYIIIICCDKEKYFNILLQKLMQSLMDGLGRVLDQFT